MKLCRSKKASTLPSDLGQNAIGLVLIIIGISLLFGLSTYTKNNVKNQLEESRNTILAQRAMLYMLNAPSEKPGTYADRLILSAHSEKTMKKEMETAEDLMKSSNIGATIETEEYKAKLDTVYYNYADYDNMPTYYLPSLDGRIIKVRVFTPGYVDMAASHSGMP